MASYLDPTRPDVGVALVTTWRVGGPAEQRAVGEALDAAWSERPWPAPGLRAYGVFAGTDGDTLLHYIQWDDERSARDRHVGTGLLAIRAEIDAAVPGIERLGGHLYRRYRSRRLADQPPGCYVTVRVEFDRPDDGRQRAWVDGVFDASASDDRPVPGLLGVHFHLGLDGERVLNLAEWTSAEAHRRLVDAPGGPVRAAANDFPGVTSVTYERFRPLFHVAA